MMTQRDQTIQGIDDGNGRFWIIIAKQISGVTLEVLTSCHCSVEKRAKGSCKALRWKRRGMISIDQWRPRRAWRGFKRWFLDGRVGGLGGASCFGTERFSCWRWFDPNPSLTFWDYTSIPYRRSIMMNTSAWDLRFTKIPSGILNVPEEDSVLADVNGRDLGHLDAHEAEGAQGDFHAIKMNLKSPNNAHRYDIDIVIFLTHV